MTHTPGHVVLEGSYILYPDASFHIPNVVEEKNVVLFHRASVGALWVSDSVWLQKYKRAIFQTGIFLFFILYLQCQCSVLHTELSVLFFYLWHLAETPLSIFFYTTVQLRVIKGLAQDQQPVLTLRTFES